MTDRATQPVVSTPFAPESGLDFLDFSDQLNDEIFNTTDFSQLASNDSYLTQCSSFDPNGLINYEENGWPSIIDLPVFLSDGTFQDTTPDSIDLLPDICVGESSGSVRHAAVSQSSVEAHEVSDHVLKGQRGQKRSDHPSISSCEPPAKRKRASKEDTGRRAKLSAHAKEILEKAFIANQYPGAADFTDLANSSGLDIKQVKTWFNNKRFRRGKTGIVIPTRASADHMYNQI